MAIAASAIWRIRPGGDDTNGGGYDVASYPGGTDYSQQNAPQYTGTNLTVDATTNTDVLPDGHTPATADVGNVVSITAGTGFTVAWYFITAIVSGKWRLDHSPAAVGTAGGTWRMGGAWGSLFTWGRLSPGNTVYVLGGAAPTYAAPDYIVDWHSATPLPASNGTVSAWVKYSADPNTPTTNGYGGKPLITWTDFAGAGTPGPYNKYTGFFFVQNSGGNAAAYMWICGAGSGEDIMFDNCVFDQRGWDYPILDMTAVGCDLVVSGCEIFSSTGGTGSSFAIACQPQYGFPGRLQLLGCNIHNCVGHAVVTTSGGFIEGNIIAKNNGDGIAFISSGGAGTDPNRIVRNNTIDGNASNGVEFAATADVALWMFVNNLITNNGGAGLKVDAGTAAINDGAKLLFDYNTFYGNASNYNNISASPHDTILVADPYVDQAHQDYTLK